MLEFYNSLGELVVSGLKPLYTLRYRTNSMHNQYLFPSGTQLVMIGSGGMRTGVYGSGRHPRLLNAYTVCVMEATSAPILEASPGARMQVFDPSGSVTFDSASIPMRVKAVSLLPATPVFGLIPGHPVSTLTPPATGVNIYVGGTYSIHTPLTSQVSRCFGGQEQIFDEYIANSSTGYLSSSYYSDGSTVAATKADGWYVVTPRFNDAWCISAHPPSLPAETWGNPPPSPYL